MTDDTTVSNCPVMNGAAQGHRMRVINGAKPVWIVALALGLWVGTGGCKASGRPDTSGKCPMMGGQAGHRPRYALGIARIEDHDAARRMSHHGDERWKRDALPSTARDDETLAMGRPPRGQHGEIAVNARRAGGRRRAGPQTFRPRRPV